MIEVAPPSRCIRCAICLLGLNGFEDRDPSQLSGVMPAILWEAAPRPGWMSAILPPPLSQVMEALGRMLASGEIATHLGLSFRRAGIGVALATLVAVPPGFRMGRCGAFERASDPLVQTLRNTSQFALLPVFALPLGVGEASKIAITIDAAVFFLPVNAVVGVKSSIPRS